MDKGIHKQLGQAIPGVGNIIRTDKNNIFFVNKNCVPKHERVIYGQVVAEIRPRKEETRHVCLTVVGDLPNFDGVMAKQCAFPSTKKILKSTVSTQGVEFMTMDLKDFYYRSSMEEYEYT